MNELRRIEVGMLRRRLELPRTNAATAGCFVERLSERGNPEVELALWRIGTVVSELGLEEARSFCEHVLGMETIAAQVGPTACVVTLRFGDWLVQLFALTPHQP